MRGLLLIGFLTLALASTAPLSTARANDCDNAQDEATMNECAEKAYKKSDAELNKLYKQIEGRLKDDPDKTKLLVAAQRAWVAFRDAECNFQSSGTSGGSINPMIVAMCLDKQTQGRITDFKSYLQCEEGDLDCPVPGVN